MNDADSKVAADHNREAFPCAGVKRDAAETVFTKEQTSDA